MSEEFSFSDLSRDLEKEELKTALRQAHTQLARAKNKQEAMVEAAFDGMQAAMLALPKAKLLTPPKPVTGAHGKSEVALWHLTDWQGAKLTTTYNTEVMRERVRRFAVQAAKITAIAKKDHTVTECCIVMTGDMLEGLFNFPTQPFEIDATLFDQVANVASLINEIVRYALSVYDLVEVVEEWGNHGRIGSKRAVVPKADNMDRFAYRLAREMLKDIDSKRLKFTGTAEDIQRIEIGNYRALAIHGDEIGRNGFASPATIVQHANKWRSGAYRWDFRDVYMGHYHTHAEWPMANGEGSVYQTGSTESDNRYARDNLASSAIPSQRLHFIDPRKGRVTAQYKITLADES